MDIYIALGANQPYKHLSPHESLQQALSQLSKREITIISASRVWQTPAWPDPIDPPYANGVACIDTSLSPDQLLSVLHDVESAFGRERSVRNAPRTLDLDLIDYKGQIKHSDVIIPHPRATRRSFVLLPLQEIASEWVDPVTERHIATLIKDLPDKDIKAAVRTDILLWKQHD